MKNIHIFYKIDPIVELKIVKTFGYIYGGQQQFYYKDKAVVTVSKNTYFSMDENGKEKRANVECLVLEYYIDDNGDLFHKTYIYEKIDDAIKDYKDNIKLIK